MIDLGEARRRRSVASAGEPPVAAILRELRASRATSAEAFAAEIEERVGRGELPTALLGLAAGAWRVYNHHRKKRPEPRREIPDLAAIYGDLPLDWVEAFLAERRERQKGIGYIDDLRPEDCAVDPANDGAAMPRRRMQHLRIERPLSDDTHRERVSRVRRIMSKIRRELRGQAAAIAAVEAVLDEELLKRA